MSRSKPILYPEDFDHLYFILGAYLGAAIREKLPADEIEAIRQLTTNLKDKLTELQTYYDTNSSQTTDSRRQ